MNLRHLLVALFALGIAGCYGSASSPAALNLEPESSANPDTVEKPQDTPTAFAVVGEQTSRVSTAAYSDKQQSSTTSTSFVPTEMPQQRSMQQFTRALFAGSADDEPVLVDAVDFVEDAEHDDFADLLAEQALQD